METAVRVTSKRNVWADVASRPELGGAGRVCEMAAAAGLPVDVVPVPAEWRNTDYLLDCA